MNVCLAMWGPEKLKLKVLSGGMYTITAVAV